MSHPSWVRGLKPAPCNVMGIDDASHPSWVRGLKHDNNRKNWHKHRRTPRGCVD